MNNNTQQKDAIRTYKPQLNSQPQSWHVALTHCLRGMIDYDKFAKDKRLQATPFNAMLLEGHRIVSIRLPTFDHTLAKLI